MRKVARSCKCNVRMWVVLGSLLTVVDRVLLGLIIGVRTFEGFFSPVRFRWSLPLPQRTPYQNCRRHVQQYPCYLKPFNTSLFLVSGVPKISCFGVPLRNMKWDESTEANEQPVFNFYLKKYIYWTRIPTAPHSRVSWTTAPLIGVCCEAERIEKGKGEEEVWIICPMHSNHFDQNRLI